MSENDVSSLIEEKDSRKTKGRIFLILAIIVIVLLFVFGFIVGASLWSDDIPLVYGIMGAIYAISSIIIGILLGFSSIEKRIIKRNSIISGILVLGILSAISGIGRILGPDYLWEHLLPWLGVVGSTATVLLLPLLVLKLRLRKL